MPEQAPTTRIQAASIFAEDLATSLALLDMIKKIPELSTEPLQQVAWESVAALLLASGDTVAEA